MSEKKTKKFPIVTYLCCLLAVSILFTGVTFSRYAGFTSGTTDVSLGRFACSYEIGDMSASTFSNAEYWLQLNGVATSMNTARSVRFSIRNYTLQENGRPDRISDVDLQSTLRLYAPAEFLGNLAVQIAEVDKEGNYITKTPQYVLEDFIYDGAGNFVVWKDGSGILDTSKSKDYEARPDIYGNQVDEKLSMSGGFTGREENHTGTISAYCAETGTSVSITSVMAEAQYSVGFYRGWVGDENKSAPQFYLDCRKEVPFYTLDISLPEMLLKANGTAQSRTFVLFLSVLNLTENQDFKSTWTESGMAENLERLEKGERDVYFNGATVTGYHFDTKANLYDYDLTDGILVANGSQTTIRIQKTFEEQGKRLSYHHVAPLSEGATSIVHPIEDFYNSQGVSVNLADIDFSSVTEVHSLFGKCSNGGRSGYISFENITDSPYYATYSAPSQTVQDYIIRESLSKGYSTLLNVLFVQSSQSSHQP